MNIEFDEEYLDKGTDRLIKDIVSPEVSLIEMFERDKATIKEHIGAIDNLTCLTVFEKHQAKLEVQNYEQWMNQMQAIVAKARREMYGKGQVSSVHNQGKVKSSSRL